jgi:pyruvate-ferredoxin/flavodoxin oxidoreductase
VRFSSLLKQFPEIASELFAVTEANAKRRLEGYKRLSAQVF